jgi:hypothetical protein
VARSREQLDGLVEDTALLMPSGSCRAGVATARNDASIAPERTASIAVANGRFESTLWTSIVVGPPLGGAATGLFGPVTTVFADAVSYLLSAVGITCAGTSGTREPQLARAGSGAVGSAGQPHRPADGNRDRWRADPGDPALAAPPAPAPQPLTKRARGYFQPSCLTSRKRCTLVAEQHVITSGSN